MRLRRRHARRMCAILSVTLLVAKLWFGVALPGFPAMGGGAVPRPRRTIVTGASANHYGTLVHQLLRSVTADELGRAANDTIIVYDLGLTEEQTAELNRCYPHILVRKFNFAAYPAFFDITKAAGEYAWKPVIMSSVVAEFGGLVLWLDAGIIALVDLSYAFDVVERQGLYTPTSPDTVKTWTHPGTLKYLKVVGAELEEMLPLDNRYGAIVGFNGAHEGAQWLIKAWDSCAREKQCIAPTGSSRENHRQDQAVLTVLYYQYVRKHKGVVWHDDDEDLGLIGHQDIREIEAVSKHKFDGVSLCAFLKLPINPELLQENAYVMKHYNLVATAKKH